MAASRNKKEQLYHVSGEEKSVGEIFHENRDMYDGHSGVQKSTAHGVGRTFVGWETDISIKSNYNRSDYEHFNSNETIPKTHNEILRVCMTAYDKVGIIKNVIDLMSDFGSQGIRLQHPNPRIERFYNKWFFEKVNGRDRSERFLNLFYRTANVVVNRAFGKISPRQADDMKKAHGIDNDDIQLEEPKPNKRQIPLQYSFLNPLSVEVIGGNISNFIGKPLYGLKISSSLKHEIHRLERSNDETSRGILDSLPNNIKEAIKSGKQIIPLDPAKTDAFFYKKDDWDMWAKPMVYSILDDLIMLEKMKLADISALDGAISNIRLWNLGIIGDGPNSSILPTKGQMSRLRNILASNTGGGTLDLVWGPELSFEETSTNVHNFLGETKYKPTLDAIYDGLGIPPTLRSGGAASNSNNFIALKTLVERLQYGRDALTDFWNKEIKLVQKAMGFRFPATVVFDQMILSDEAAEKQILINMVDRDIISSDTLLERFDIKPELEALRVKRSAAKRESGSMPDKASPFHNPQFEEDYKKIILQQGGVAPSEIGVELLPKKEGEQSRHDQQKELQLELKQIDAKQKNKDESNKPKGDAGRPKNVTETKKRKPKPKDKPRQNTKGNQYDFVSMFIWANEAQKDISKIVTPAILSAYEKKDVRSLTKGEAEELEYIKAGVLFSIYPYDEIDEQKVYNSLQNNNPITKEHQTAIDSFRNQFAIQNDRSPTVEEMRQIYSSVFSLIYEEEE